MYSAKRIVIKEIKKPTGEVETLKAVIIKCYEICKRKDFENVKVLLVGDETLHQRVGKNLAVLDYIDYDSELYKSLLGIGKKALKELKDGVLDYWYHYLIQYFSEINLLSIVNKKSTSIDYSPELREKKKKVDDEPRFICNSKNEIVINPNWTGKRLKVENDKHEKFKKEFTDDF